MGLHTLVGIDVGGTNTDAVLIDADAARADVEASILASCKTPTTRYVGDGIARALEKVLEQWTGDERQRILDSLVRINIGTTQFLNAIIERDSQKLSPVALLRLCGPYTRELPGFAGIPPELRHIIEGTTVYLSGGLEYNGTPIAPLDEAEIRRTAAELRSRKIFNIAIVGVHTSLDFTHRQEETVARILTEELGSSAVITLSRDVAGLGLLERENATVINAALRPLAETTVANLRQSLASLGIRAPAFFTQNNGTLISASEAKRLPILTYLSGPINSLTGAAFLSREQGPFEKDVIVVDVGGTTTDTCVLQPTGLPRPAAAFSLLSGARTNFSVPDLRSIGLGGGSLVHVDEETGTVTVGPESVGYQLETRSRIFGGPDLTVTDVVFTKEGAGIGKYAIKPSDAESVKVSADVIRKVDSAVARLLETVIDETKTEAGPVDIILVGGGTFLVPLSIQGAGQIYRPNYGHVANAVGAAMARVSHRIDRIVSVGAESTEEQELSQQCQRTIDEAQAKGVLGPQIVQKTTMALSYSSTRELRIITTAVGDAPFEQSTERNEDVDVDSSKPQHEPNRSLNVTENRTITIADPTREAGLYKPSVFAGKWKLSETDLFFLSEGCGILGCGGGGDPYPSFLSAQSLLRAGESVYVVDPSSISSHGVVPAVGFMGSPDILSERFPSGEELKHSVQSVAQYQNATNALSGVISLEIGGSNGFRGIQAAAWTHTPVIDADLMGRAYPNLWQTTLTRAKIPITPCAVSDAKGNTLIHHRAATHQDVENFLRPLCGEMGNAAGISLALLNGDQIRNSTVHHSLSLAWRLGRAVYIARQEKTSVVDSILAEYPGRLIFSGKIVRVKRAISGGFSRGLVEMVKSSNLGSNNDDDHPVRIEFQNENLRVTRQDKTLAVVPDLITVLDSETGSAVGTQDYRYGLHVFVVALVASPQWSEKEGLAIGGPAAFQLGDEYVPVAEYRAVRSVIDEYGN
ncbi:Protein of unknown function DUF917 [Penicillium occitanis (nom. inval.)]|nr:Protein of unknown function DUF917 [Penicillium occitanis (nom. inval.)]PCG98430.1 hypothetical protein PENOC_063030 [Penicillium occitanis (nom. inval.)]